MEEYSQMGLNSTEQEKNWVERVFLYARAPLTTHILIKLELIKITLLGVFGAGVVATIIGKGRLKVPKIQRIKSNLSHLMA